MEEILNNLSRDLFGRTRNDDVCVSCGSQDVRPEDFRNEISRREFSISRMCQKCQDSVFGPD
jgi:hypothetical protein